jgi:uncharacterized protein YndB with AHSA1/START domain
MVDQIERELVLDAPPEEVWQVVTSSGWLAEEVEFDLTPAGEATFRSGERLRTGWVEEVVAPGDEEASHARLVFWWSADGEPASRVELTLDPDDERRTRMRVIEARPLEVLDVVGIPLSGSGGAHGPSMLVAA